MLKAKLGKRKVKVASAGVYATENSPASIHTQSICKSMAGGAECHKSQPLTPELLAEFDMVYCMTENHVQHILAVLPNFEHKVKCIGELAGYDISDPFGGSLESYKKTHDCLSPAIEKIMDILYPKRSKK